MEYLLLGILFVMFLIYKEVRESRQILESRFSKEIDELEKDVVNANNL